MPRAEFVGGPLHGREAMIEEWVNHIDYPIRPPVNSPLLTIAITYRAIVVLPDRIVFLVRDDQTAYLEQLMQSRCWTVAWFLWRECCFSSFLANDAAFQEKLAACR